MKMTWKKLFTLIDEGYGQGHFDDYKPFLFNTRRSTSKESNQSSGNWLPGYRRCFEYMARVERRIALLALWLGAVDVREQFPMWPVPHEHPLVGAPGTENILYPTMPGLLEIAADAGIRHGTYVHTDIPYIATVDFLLTVRRKGKPALVAISCKPREITSAAVSTSRMLERMELERLYSKILQAPLFVADAHVHGKILTANLEWLCSAADAVASIREDEHFEHFRRILKQTIHHTPLNFALDDAAHAVGWDRRYANKVFRRLAWTQYLDIDLSERIVMSAPAKAGGVVLRKRLQLAMLGEIDDECA